MFFTDAVIKQTKHIVSFISLIANNWVETKTPFSQACFPVFSLPAGMNVINTTWYSVKTQTDCSDRERYQPSIHCCFA